MWTEDLLQSWIKVNTSKVLPFTQAAIGRTQQIQSTLCKKPNQNIWKILRSMQKIKSFLLDLRINI